MSWQLGHIASVLSVEGVPAEKEAGEETVAAGHQLVAAKAKEEVGGHRKAVGTQEDHQMVVEEATVGTVNRLGVGVNQAEEDPRFVGVKTAMVHLMGEGVRKVEEKVAEAMAYSAQHGTFYRAPRRVW